MSAALRPRSASSAVLMSAGLVLLPLGAAALARGRGPAYWVEEAGILAAGLLWSALGAAALVRARGARATEGRLA